MAIKISELPYQPRPKNSLLMETSSLNEGTGQLESLHSKLFQLTRRFNFQTVVSSPNIFDEYELLVIDAQSVEELMPAAYNDSSTGSRSTNGLLSGTFDVSATCTEIDVTDLSQCRGGSSLNRIVLNRNGDNGISGINDYVVDSSLRGTSNIPDFASYFSSSIYSVAPIITRIEYDGGNLFIFAKLAADGYSTYGDILIYGHCDVNLALLGVSADA